MKSLIWIGATLAAIGFAVLFGIVVPHLNPDTTLGLNGLPQAPLALWPVALSSVSLAVGAVLVGIGVGRWTHPNRRHTLDLGQPGHSSEV